MKSERYDGADPALSIDRRNFGLDFARCAAISLVVLAHYVGQYHPGTDLIDRVAVALGFIGVELFFSLSGFLIGRLLIRLAETEPGLAATGRFWLRRWLRTLPAYYVCLGFLMLYTGYYDWPSVFFLQSFYPLSARFYVVSWSLVMEEYFYLAYPLLMLGLARPLCLQRRADLAGICAASMILLWSLARYLGLRAGIPFSDPSFHADPLMRLDCCAYGVLAAWLMHRHPASVQRALGMLPYSVLWLLLLALYAGWGALYVLLFDPAWQQTLGLTAWGNVYAVFQSSALDALSAVLVLFLLLRMQYRGTILARGIGFIGRISYSLYLVHPLVFAFAFAPLLASHGRVAGGLESLALIIGASWLLYILVERSFLRLRDRYIGDSRGPARAAIVPDAQDAPLALS